VFPRFFKHWHEVKSWSKEALAKGQGAKELQACPHQYSPNSTQNEVVKYGLELEHLNACKLPSVVLQAVNI